MPKRMKLQEESSGKSSTEAWVRMAKLFPKTVIPRDESAIDFLDIVHMHPFYPGAQYLTNGPLLEYPTFLIGCTLF